LVDQRLDVSVVELRENSFDKFSFFLEGFLLAVNKKNYECVPIGKA
jgi:hypothetical protein